MTAVLIPRRLRELLDVTHPAGTGLPDQGVPVLHSSNSSFVIQTIAAGSGGGGSFSLGASNLGNTLGQTGVTGSRIVLAGVGNITLSQLTDLSGGTISISGGTVAAGAAFSLGASGGNVSGNTGVTGTRVALAGGNGITLSQATDPSGGTITISGITQSAQTQDRFDLTLDGNTAGALQMVSSGTLTLAGGNSITLSQNGNAITISGASTSQSVQTQPIQTGISSIVASDATYTSGSVQFTGSGIVTIRSSANQRVVVDASQSVQTQSRFNLTISGNTAGAGALVSSGTLSLAGGNNITLSQAGNAITISGAAAGGAQTAISGVAASNTTYSSGTITITGVGGGVTVSSNTGQRIDISVATPVAQTGTQFSAGISGGNTSGHSGTVAGRVVLAGGNNITLSGSTNGASESITISAASQTAQTQNLHNVTLSGNTAGAMAQISSGTMTLAGGNNITVSQAGNAVTISGANIGGAQTGISGIANSQTTYTSGSVTLSELGAITIRSTTGNQFQFSVNAQSVQPETQTFLGGLAASNTTYTSGTVSLTGVGGGVTVSSNTGQRVDISVAAPVAQTVQTQNVVDVTLSGNTAGAMALVSSGTLTLAGGNNVTLSQAGNAVTISGPSTVAQTNQAGSVFAVGNTTSSSSGTYDARTLSLRGDGIISIAATNSGFRISATESVQTQNLHNVTLSGNTAGVMAQISSGTMSLAGGNGITLSQAGNAVTISGVTQSAESQSIGMSNLGNTSGTTGIASGPQVRFLFAGGNNITLSQSLNGASGTITISGANVGGAQTGISGIANSETTYTSGSVTFSQLGAITIRSTTGQHFQFSVNPQSVQPETQTFVGGVANSQTTYTSGTVSLSELGAITIRSTTGNQFQLSVNAQSTQPGIQHLVVSNTTFSSGTVSLSGFGDVTVNTAANLIRISAPVQTAQTGISGLANSQTTYTSGTVSLSELGAITIRSTTGNQFQFSVAAQTAESQSIGMSNIGNTSGTTGIASGAQVRFLLAGGNNITLSQSLNGASGTITISAFTQTVQTQNLHNVTLSGNTSGVMAQISSGTLTLAGGNNITLSQAGNAVTISGANVGGAQTGISGIAASNTTYTSGTVTFTGVGGGITVSSNTGQRIDLSVAAQTVQTLGMYAVENTTGQSSSTTMDARTISIAGDGAVSAGYSAGSLRISAPAMSMISAVAPLSTTTAGSTISILGPEQFSAGISGGNTSGHTGTVTGQVVLAGGNGITLSGSTNAGSQTITISGGAGGGIQHLVVSNTTFSSGTVSLSGFGDVTVNTAANLIRISAPVQTAQTGISGLANSQTTYTSGTVSLSELGAITIRSTTGNQFQLSVNSQSVQTQGQMSAGVSTGGNTAGDTGVTGTRLVFVGSNNVTLSQATAAAGGTITISGPTTVAQTNQAGSVYAVGNTTSSSSGTYDARTLSIRGDGIISVAATNSGWRISATESVQTQNLHNVTLSGNTSGVMAQVSSGTLTLAGGNNITLSQAGNAITISGANVGGAQTGISGIANSQTTYTSGTVSLSELGAITIRSTTGNQFQLSVNAQSVQPETQTFVGGLAASDTTYTSGTISITGVGGGVTVSSNTGQRIDISVATPVAQTNQAGSLYAIGNTTSSSSGTYDARTLSISGAGIISVAATNSGFKISATESVQTQNLHNVTLSGNTAGAMAQISSGTMTLAGGNGITLSQAGNAVTISGGAGGAAFSAGASNLGNTAGATGVSGTQMVLVGSGVMSLSQTTGANGNTVSILAPAQSAISAVAPLSTSTAGSTISILGPAQLSVGLSNIGNTVGDTGVVTARVVLAGGNGITLSGSTNAGSQTITISGGAGGAAFSAGVSNLGNSAGATGVTGTRLVLVGTNNISLSQTTDAGGATISISGQSPAGGAFSGGVSNLGNTAGATGITGSQMVLVGTNAISLSQTTGANGGTVSIDAPATSSLVGVSGISVSTGGSTISLMQTSGGPYAQEFNPYSAAPQTFGQQGQGTLHIQPMEINPDLRMDRILLPVVISNATNSSGSITLSQWVGLFTRNASTLSMISSTSRSTNFTGAGTVGSFSLYGGRRWMSIPWTMTLSQGDYYLGIVSRSTTGGAAGHSLSQILLTQQSHATFSGWSGLLGAATTATMQHLLGLGFYSVTTSGIPASISFAALTGSGTLAMMPPIYALRSGTV